MFSSEITSPTEARAGFFQLLDRVAQNHQVCIINRRDGENVALIAESDLNSLIETVYLFRSPTNASRLLDSLAEMKSGQLAPQSIEELQRELSISGEEKKQS
jgi:antitoxin YefM